VATWIDQCDQDARTITNRLRGNDLNYATTTPVSHGTGTTAAGGFTWIVGGTFQPLSSVISGGTLTQCYGNVDPGDHTREYEFHEIRKFNQSITLFTNFNRILTA